MLKSKTNLPAFTLIETLLAISFIALFCASLFIIYTNTSRYSQAEKTKLELAQNGRILLDRLSRELRQTNEIVSILPATGDDPDNPALTEISFQNGHDTNQITYIRYYLSVNQKQVYREHSAYYFSDDPDTYVRRDSLNQSGEGPIKIIFSDEPIADYIKDLAVWGSPLVEIQIQLEHLNQTINSKTAISARNI